MAQRSEVDNALIGREVELGALMRLLERGLRGQPAVGVVVGEAGIGKTRLVTALVDAAQARGVSVVWAAARSGEAPLELWSHLLRPAGGGAAATSLAVAEQRWELLDQLEELVGGCLPSLMVVEDVHWAEPASVRLLEELATRLATRPAAIVVTARVGLSAGRGAPMVGRLGELGRLGEVVHLGGLTAEEVGALTRALGVGVDTDAEQLCQRTGGNPLFVREVLALGQAGNPIRLTPLGVVVVSEPNETLVRCRRGDTHTRSTLCAAVHEGVWPGRNQPPPPRSLDGRICIGSPAAGQEERLSPSSNAASLARGGRSDCRGLDHDTSSAVKGSPGKEAACAISK